MKTCALCARNVRYQSMRQITSCTTFNEGQNWISHSAIMVVQQENKNTLVIVHWNTSPRYAILLLTICICKNLIIKIFNYSRHFCLFKQTNVMDGTKTHCMDSEYLQRISLVVRPLKCISFPKYRFPHCNVWWMMKSRPRTILLWLCLSNTAWPYKSVLCPDCPACKYITSI